MTVEVALEASVLVLDDLDLAPEVHGSAVVDVIHARHRENLPTIVTTTLTPAETAQRFGDGSARRLFERGMATVIELPVEQGGQVSWVRIDDRAPEHRKQLAAGAVASWLWVCGLAYANRQPARDGFVPAAVLPMLYPMPGVAKQAARLVDAGLWECVEGGFQIHDYLDFQPSRADVEQASARKAEAGRRGGIKSGEARRSKSEATGQGNAKHGASSVASPHSNPHPDPDPIPIPSRPEPLESAPSALRLTPAQPTNGSTKASRKKPKTAAPARTESAESIDAWCAKWGIPSPTSDAEVQPVTTFQN